VQKSSRVNAFGWWRGGGGEASARGLKGRGTQLKKRKMIFIGMGIRYKGVRGEEQQKPSQGTRKGNGELVL